MAEYEFISNSPVQTEAFGFLLGKKLAKGDILLLDGELGAGKTCFTRGIARALCIDEPTVSPTYTLVNEYHSGKIPLYHYDAYRLCSGDELAEIGCEEIMDEGVIIVEWAVNVRDFFSDNCIEIAIERLDNLGEDLRKIHIKIDEERGDYIVNSLC